MRTANEIRASRLREAACCKACVQGKDCERDKVSADHPPKGDGSVERQTEDTSFAGRAARAILEGKEEPPVPAPKSPALSRALDSVRAGLRCVSG